MLLPLQNRATIKLEWKSTKLMWGQVRHSGQCNILPPKLKNEVSRVTYGCRSEGCRFLRLWIVQVSSLHHVGGLGYERCEGRQSLRNQDVNKVKPSAHSDYENIAVEKEASTYWQTKQMSGIKKCCWNVKRNQIHLGLLDSILLTDFYNRHPLPGLIS